MWIRTSALESESKRWDVSGAFKKDRTGTSYFHRLPMMAVSFKVSRESITGIYVGVYREYKKSNEVCIFKEK